jgi:hypothetical protein
MARFRICASLLLVLACSSAIAAPLMFSKVEPNKGRVGALVTISQRLSFQATATPSGKDLRFEVQITCKGCVKELGVGTELEKVQTENIPFPGGRQVCPCFDDYPNAPKVTTTQTGDTRTAIFTVPGAMIEDDRLVLVFGVAPPTPEGELRMPGGEGYYAVLKEFRPN